MNNISVATFTVLSESANYSSWWIIVVDKLSESENYQIRRVIGVCESWESTKLLESENYRCQRIIQVGKLSDSAYYPSQQITRVGVLSESDNYPNRQITRVTELLSESEICESAKYPSRQTILVGELSKLARLIIWYVQIVKSAENRILH